MRLTKLLFVWIMLGIGYAWFVPRLPDAAPPPPNGALPSPDTPTEQVIPQPGGENWPALDPMGEVSVQVGKRENAVGSAFAVGEADVWITARHVIDGCSKVGLAIDKDRPGQERKYARAEAFYWHPNADIGVIVGGNSGNPLQITKAAPASGLSGFHFGYPQGKPAAVRSLLIGEARLRSKGRYSTRERALVWAGIERRPDFKGTLGGISGGPVVDGEGRVLGVTVASSKRRGRIITTTPETMRDMLARAKRQALPESGQPLRHAQIDKANFDEIGREWRDGHSVTKVACVTS